MPLLRTEDWMAEAACAGKGPDLFHPEVDHRRLGQGGFTAEEAAAKAVCAGCPVAEECLDYATRLYIGVGVWGGLTGQERRRMRRRRRGAA
jgi:WhiB family redox-sensing transcriptional regulator